MSDLPHDGRDALRAAIAAREAGKAAAARAAEAAARGRSMLADAEAELAAHADADARIAAHQIAVVRAGGDLASPLPPDLLAARAARRDAQDGLDTARTVAAALDGELAGAQKAAQVAADAVRTAALAVTYAEAAGMAQRLATLETEAAELRSRVMNLPPASGVALPARLAQAINARSPILDAIDPPANTRVRMAGRWLAYAEALIGDPEARLDDVPLPGPGAPPPRVRYGAGHVAEMVG